MSAKTLLRLAAALQLDRDETEHLFILAGQAPPVQREKDRPTLAGLKELFGELEDWPAFSVCKRWDILEWNEAANALFGGLDRLPEVERNLMWLVFTRPAFRKWYVGQRMAECTVNHFHANYNERLEEENWLALVCTLERRTPEFRRIWQAHGVSRPPDWTKRMEHPVGGQLTFETLTLLSQGGDIRVILYRPADAGTRKGMRRVLRGWRETAGA